MVDSGTLFRRFGAPLGSLGAPLDGSGAPPGALGLPLDGVGVHLGGPGPASDGFGATQGGSGEPPDGLRVPLDVFVAAVGLGGGAVGRSYGSKANEKWLRGAKKSISRKSSFYLGKTIVFEALGDL